MGPQTELFYLSMFLVGAGIGWFLVLSLSGEGGLLSRYAARLVETSELMFESLTPRNAKAQILMSSGFTALGALFFVAPLVEMVFGAFGYVALFMGGAFVGWRLPGWISGRRLKSRHKSFDGQLVDALVMLSNALRSGLSLVQGFRIVSREMQPPLSQEFELVLREQKISTDLDDALMNLAKRIQSKDLEIVVTSILTLRETGGSLPETFDTVTYTIRERKKVEGKIESLTAAGLTQGVAACVIPYVFLLLMGLAQPQLVKPLVTTPIGWFCIFAATVLDILGYVFIRRVVTIKV